MRWRPSADLTVPATIIAVMSVVAALGFRGVFPDWSFVPAAIVGATGATLIMCLGRLLRLSAPEAVLMSLFGFGVLGAVAAAGVPTPDAFSTFGDGLINGWSQVLSSVPPADVTAEYRVLPYAIAWAGAMVGGEALRISRIPGLGAAGPILALAVSLLITLEDRSVALSQGVVLLIGTLALTFVQQRRRSQHLEFFEDQTIETPSRMTGVVPAVGMLALVAITAPLLGPRLPFASSNERFDLREFQVPPFDPLEAPTPLSQIKAGLTTENAEFVVFTVTSSTMLDRFPLAVLDHYNSEFWAVADEDGDAAGEFRPIDSAFPEPTTATVHDRQSVAATFEIVDLDQVAGGDFDPVWLPLPGWPQTIASEERLDIRFNADTGTVAIPPDGPSAGLAYDVAAFVPPSISQVDLRSADVAPREPLDLAAPQLLSLAGDVLEGADAGWEQVEAIRSAFVDRGFYDSRELSDTARTGHRLARLAEFVDDPQRIVGFEEQYAATAALLARGEGLDARVVVGFQIDPDDLENRWQGGRLEVVAEDMSAWIEVNFIGIGWLPFDVTPPRDREPEDTSVGRSQREVAIPNPPPDPPPPVLPPELDRDAEVEEDDDEDVDEEEASDDGGGFPVAAVAVGALAVSPVVLLVGGALLVVLLKRRRTRRRREADMPSRRVAGAWHEVVDRYEELGAKPRRNATTAEFARGVRAADLAEESEGALLLALARDADEAAYHPEPAPDERAVAAWSRSDELRQQLARRQGPLARLRHRIDPRPLFRPDPIIDTEDSDE